MPERPSLVLADDPTAALASANDPEQFVLSVLDAVKGWLVTASHVEDVAEVRARAEAIRVYAAQAGLGRDAEQAACEIRLRAERRMGELLAAGQAEGTIASKGRNPGTRSGMRQPHTRTTTYRELGITDAHTPASLKALASVPEERFETATTDLRKAGSLSHAGVLRAAGETRQRRRGGREEHAPGRAQSRPAAWGRPEEPGIMRPVFVFAEALATWKERDQSVECWAVQAAPVVSRLLLDWGAIVDDLRTLGVVAEEVAAAIERNL